MTRCLGLLCCCLCVILTLVKAISVEKKPYGPKMCEQFCEVVYCTFKFYFPSVLFCNVMFDSSSGKNKRHAVITRTRNKKHTVQLVSNANIMGKTTSMTVHTSSDSPNTGNTANPTEEDRQSNKRKANRRRFHILVAPHDKSNNIRKLNMYNLSVREYPQKRKVKIISLVYIQPIEKVIFGTEAPRRKLGTLSAINLKLQNVALLQRDITSLSLAVDEGNEKVYISLNRPMHKTGIYTMNFKGKNYIQVAETVSSPRSIALDISNEIIYVCFGIFVQSISFQGNVIHRLDGSRTYAVAIKPSGHFLYYNRKKDVYRADADMRKPSKVFSLKFVPDTFVLYMDLLVISSFSENIIATFDFKNGRLEHIPKIHDVGNVICLFD